MRYKEFLEYLENNLDNYQTFMNKALEYQKEKNQKRQAKKRWDEEKLQRAAYDMWKASMENLYNNLKQELKSGSASDWTNYIIKNNILESVNDGISQLDFSDDDCC